MKKIFAKEFPYSPVWFFGIFVISALAGIVLFSHKPEDFLHWDAAWYSSIVSQGYIFDQYHQSNTGFFPLFPYLWKSVNLGVLWICVLNFILFIISITLLIYEFKINKYIILIYLSFPTLFFNFIPYSEALFFFCSTLLLVGFRRNNLFIIIIGTFFSSLTRATAIFYVPIIIFMFLYFYINNFKNRLRYFSFYLVILIAGVTAFALVIFFQWLNTGKWFAYTYQQIYIWDHGLRIPKFPLTDWGIRENLWHDGLAFLLSFFALFVITNVLYFKIFKKKMILNDFDHPSLFSFLFLSCIFLYVLFFHPDYNGTSLLSASRYVFCVPFTLIFLNKLWSDLHIKLNLYLTTGFIVAVLLLFGIFTVPFTYRLFIYFLLIGFYVFAYIFSFVNKNTYILIFISVLQFCLQLYEFQRFLQGHWVG